MSGIQHNYPIYIYCEVITTINQVVIHHHNGTIFFVWWEFLIILILIFIGIPTHCCQPFSLLSPSACSPILFAIHLFKSFWFLTQFLFSNLSASFTSMPPFSIIAPLSHCTSPYWVTGLCSCPPLIHSLHFGRILFVRQTWVSLPSIGILQVGLVMLRMQSNVNDMAYKFLQGLVSARPPTQDAHTGLILHVSTLSVMQLHGSLSLLWICHAPFCLGAFAHVRKVPVSFSAYQVHAYTPSKPHLKHQFHRENFS